MTAVPEPPETQAEPPRSSIIVVLNNPAGNHTQVALLLLQSAKPERLLVAHLLEIAVLHQIDVVSAVPGRNRSQLAALRQALHPELPYRLEHGKSRLIRLPWRGEHETLVDE